MTEQNQTPDISADDDTDTEGHLRRGDDDTDTDDTEGHLRRGDDDTDTDDTEGHLRRT